MMNQMKKEKDIREYSPNVGTNVNAPFNDIYIEIQKLYLILLPSE